MAPFAELQVARRSSIQVFDSWVGAMAPYDYVRFSRAYAPAPYRAHSVDRRARNSLGLALRFFRSCMASGGDVQGVDCRINIDQAVWD